MNKSFFDQFIQEEDTTTASPDPLDFEFNNDSSDTESDDTGSTTYENKYLDEIEEFQNKDPKNQLETMIHSELPADFLDNISIFDNKDFSGAKVSKDNKVVFVVAEMWPIKRIIAMRRNNNCYIDNDALFGLGDDGFGNMIVMNTNDNTYHVYYHDIKENGKNKLVQIATNFVELLSLLGHVVTEKKDDDKIEEAEPVDSSNQTSDDSLNNNDVDDLSDDVPETDSITHEYSTFDTGYVGPSRFNKIFTESDNPEKDGDSNDNKLDDNDQILDDAVKEVESAGSADEDSDDKDDNTTDDGLSTSPDGEDLSHFGTDDSDVHNQFNQKDIEILNKLIASESEAINDYFDGAMETKDTDLTALYGDIGKEERFHLEQLMYAKSKRTGEKYEPRDPKVKSEYEELINGGMDEETAAYTAIDKVSLIEPDTRDDSDIEKLEQEAAYIYDNLLRDQILTSAVLEHYNSYKEDKATAIIVEAFIMEAVDDATSKTKISNPFALMAKGIRFAVDGIVKMGNVIREATARNKVKLERKMEWLKKNKIDGLLSEGIDLYFYDDKKSAITIDSAIQYIDLLYRLTLDIGKTCGVRVDTSKVPAKIKNGISYSNIDAGITLVKRAVLTKTKLVINDQNRVSLTQDIFGYNDTKMNVDFVDKDGNKMKKSDNVFNRFTALMNITKQYSDITLTVYDNLSKLQSNMNSVYYKNRKVYDSAAENLKVITNAYKQFITAIAHDISELLKLDKRVLELTNKRDAADKNGTKIDGPDIRVNKNSPNLNNSK